MSSPTFTISRRCEQAIDKPQPCIRARIRHELLYFFSRRRESDQIKECAADESPLFCFRRRRETAGFQTAQDKTIDVVPDPGSGANGRRRRTYSFLKRPQRRSLLRLR